MAIVAACTLASTALPPWGAARAQDSSAQAAPSPAEGREPTAEERQAAADAFDRGTRAYLARDYERAAQWFETAYRMAPAAAAMIQAIRAHQRAGNVVRAATLALRLEAVHGSDRDAHRQAEQALRLGRELVRVDVRCREPGGGDAPCTVELDGTLMEHPSFFVAAATDHTVRATFETGPVEQAVAAAEAGQSRELSFEAPPRPEPVATTEGEGTETGATQTTTTTVATTEPSSSGGGISPAFAITGLGLTAVAGGLLIWSGVDTLDGVDDYEAMPTTEGLADGQSRETRTNVLIGVTAGLAAVTLVMAIFTDWDGDPPPADEGVTIESAALAPVPGGAYAAIGGRFR